MEFTLRPTNRVAVFLDVENLVSDELRRRDWPKAGQVLREMMARAKAQGLLVYAVAVVHRGAAGPLAFELAGDGVRVFGHDGGPNRADLDLIGRIQTEIPGSCNTVIIGSGDGIFADAAARLRINGRRVVALARPGTISADLYVEVDEFVPWSDAEADLHVMAEV